MRASQSPLAKRSNLFAKTFLGVALPLVRHRSMRGVSLNKVHARIWPTSLSLSLASWRALRLTRMELLNCPRRKAGTDWRVRTLCSCSWARTMMSRACQPASTGHCVRANSSVPDSKFVIRKGAEGSMVAGVRLPLLLRCAWMACTTAGRGTKCRTVAT